MLELKLGVFTVGDYGTVLGEVSLARQLSAGVDRARRLVLAPCARRLVRLHRASREDEYVVSP